MTTPNTPAPRTLRFAIFGNSHQEKKSAAVRKLLESLLHHGAVVTVDSTYHQFLLRQGLIGNMPLDTFEGDAFEADFAVSMGGDGTLLRTARRVGAKQTPIIGVNMGRLGFLADVASTEIDDMVEAVYNGSFTTETRRLVELQGYGCALNDVAILKRDSASMIAIRVTVNGEYLTTYQADGLIISTPTGSTAYSLSNGGPIIAPGTGVMLLTPVAPHSLSVRPIVLHGSSQVELTVSSRSRTFLVALDGSSMALPEGTTLRLRRADHVANIVKRPSSSFFATLREKLMWGADVREENNSHEETKD